MSGSVYGLLAEFSTSEALLGAAKRAREDGYRNIEAYSPYAVEGIAEAVGFVKSRVPLITLVGGIVGAVGGYFLQWYSAVIDYPINVGGRPLHSWPSFIAPTFELTILGASIAAVVGMLAANGLPRLNHPVFNAPHFEQATRNRFFLCLTAHDPHFDIERSKRFLQELQPMSVVEVPR
ncbi:DUF3341 domain-containing protein [Paraburkholderia rhynchosiae]|uniref:DUF3341 domain-containing protein n=1 Tax=Paraburkholderia rhynchosiae TaxID=487049 RepID=A0A2N7WSC0_9BURK|nr:DUF3341 domain-containing protein [Paraburkholderia rhynchosiae]PMS32284.1 DUF3341 domain-containing protein [Paraburkholderia rhynchosiae]CAB3732435.1 hypothetical protein LMG27174_05930 [Paraburkholderia rhynchosiae]